MDAAAYVPADVENLSAERNSDSGNQEVAKRRFTEVDMEKKIKHENMLQPSPRKRKSGYNYFEFICRGCSIKYRKNIWYGFRSSISDSLNRKMDNSYWSAVKKCHPTVWHHMHRKNNERKQASLFG